MTDRHDPAIADFTKVIEISRELTQINNFRGNAYLKELNCKKAIDDCNKTLVIDPKSVEAYWNRSRACFETNQCTKTLKDAEALQNLGYPGPEEFCRALLKVLGKKR